MWGAMGAPLPVLPCMQGAGALVHHAQGAGKSLAHTDIPAQSHTLLPGEPASESPLLKAKVRDTETGTAERMKRGREGGRDGHEVADRPRGRMRKRITCQQPWAELPPLPPSPLPTPLTPSCFCSREVLASPGARDTRRNTEFSAVNQQGAP